ncbi:DUF4402 domain-containing protein [Parasphingorhabdus sp.]|uniref:DUF4402 domain-containing protein n=1 Tax=Parasphingorhabdus sp. TaxID=2709688 RepID=UPI003002B40D
MKYFRHQNQARTAVQWATLLTAALCLASPVAAASDSSDARVFIRQPVTMTKTADLIFGDFVTGTADSIFRLDPRSGLLSQRNGDAVSVGGTQSFASIEVLGTALSRVQLSTGKQSILIQRDGGTETMQIDRFRFDRRRKMLNAAGLQTFNIGGQLRVGANQKAGTYRGSFDVSVDYF